LYIIVVVFTLIKIYSIEHSYNHTSINSLLQLQNHGIRHQIKQNRMECQFWRSCTQMKMHVFSYYLHSLTITWCSLVTLTNVCGTRNHLCAHHNSKQILQEGQWQVSYRLNVNILQCPYCPSLIENNVHKQMKVV